MLDLLWLIPARCPSLAFLVLACSAARLSRERGRGASASAPSACRRWSPLAGRASTSCWHSAGGQRILPQALWTWIDVGGFAPQYRASISTPCRSS